jgi:hypothetical protein
MYKARPPRFIRDSSLIRPVAFDKCLFLKIPRIVCPSSDFNVIHILVYAWPTKSKLRCAYYGRNKLAE